MVVGFFPLAYISTSKFGEIKFVIFLFIFLKIVLNIYFVYFTKPKSIVLKNATSVQLSYKKFPTLSIASQITNRHVIKIH